MARSAPSHGLEQRQIRIQKVIILICIVIVNNDHDSLMEGEDTFNKLVLFYSFTLLPFLVTDPQFPFTKYGMSQKWRINNKCANMTFDMLVNAPQWTTIIRDFENLNGDLDPAIPATIIRLLGAKWRHSYIIAQIVLTLVKFKSKFEDEEIDFELAIDEEIKVKFDQFTNYLENKRLISAFEIEPLIKVRIVQTIEILFNKKNFVTFNYFYRLVNFLIF